MIKMIAEGMVFEDTATRVFELVMLHTMTHYPFDYRRLYVAYRHDRELFRQTAALCRWDAAGSFCTMPTWSDTLQRNLDGLYKDLPPGRQRGGLPLCRIYLFDKKERGDIEDRCGILPECGTVSDIRNLKDMPKSNNIDSGDDISLLCGFDDTPSLPGMCALLRERYFIQAILLPPKINDNMRRGDYSGYKHPGGESIDNFRIEWNL